RFIARIHHSRCPPRHRGTAHLGSSTATPQRRRPSAAVILSLAAVLPHHHARPAPPIGRGALPPEPRPLLPDPDSAAASGARLLQRRVLPTRAAFQVIPVLAPPRRPLPPIAVAAGHPARARRRCCGVRVALRGAGDRRRRGRARLRPCYPYSS